MQVDMELDHRTWIAAVKLALVASAIASIFAIGMSSFGDVPHAVIVLPVIVIAFAASWVRTGRVREQPVTPPLRSHHRAVPIA
jgi:hypothetical protein